MSIPTHASLHGFIARSPVLSLLPDGTARMYARVGVEHWRREPDGAFTKLETTFHDLVVFDTAAQRAYTQFWPGDVFVASGHIHTHSREHDDRSVACEEFVARHIGHDTARTHYEVDRTPINAHDPAPAPAPAQEAGVSRRMPGVGL